MMAAVAMESGDVEIGNELRELLEDVAHLQRHVAQETAA